MSDRLLSQAKRDDYFQNELEWLYQRLASDVEALVPEANQDNVRWIIKDNFGKEIERLQDSLTLKAVGEWLEGKQWSFGNIQHLVEALKRGEFPE